MEVVVKMIAKTDRKSKDRKREKVRRDEIVYVLSCVGSIKGSKGRM